MCCRYKKNAFHNFSHIVYNLPKKRNDEVQNKASCVKCKSFSKTLIVKEYNGMSKFRQIDGLKKVSVLEGLEGWCAS